MSEGTRPSLKWHQTVGLLLLVPLIVLAVWTLADPTPAAGWLFAASGLFLLTSTYDLYTKSTFGRGRLWLVGLGVLLAAMQLYAGFYLLVGRSA